MGFPWTRNPNRVFPRKELGPKTWFIKQSSGQVKSLGQLNWGCHLVPFPKEVVPSVSSLKKLSKDMATLVSIVTLELMVSSLVA
jgi:hypothetical protein